MKKFQFKFETILKQRKLREEDALRALGAAQRAYQHELNERARLVFELNLALKRREDLGSPDRTERLGIIEFQLEDEFISGTKHRITRADHAIARASRAVEKALRIYLNARKQLRAMEVLREKAYAEYRRERAKYEQRLQDDITMMRGRLREAGEVA